ncbi:MAG: SPOR domain-containing protein [Bacteroidales bacterium]|nr:SPOR domain-containing protein [Bacteroidales bacterium]
MRKLLFLSSILMLTSIIMLGQNIEPVAIEYFNPHAYNGKISITQDVKVKDFIETFVGLNKKRRGFYGYRVKIYAQNGSNARKAANSIRLKFQNSKHKAYVTYTEPNFEVVVGNFTKRFDAVEILHELKEDYPEAYIIKTIVECPKH